MSALAIEPRPDLTRGRVPVEFVGRARLLRNRIAAAHITQTVTVERLLAPIVGRNTTPLSRRTMLGLLPTHFRKMPEFGRLRLVVNSEDGICIRETRAAPFRIVLPGWDEDELAIAITLRTTTLRLPAHVEDATVMMAAIGLHAIARRFERGCDRSDVGVLRDLTCFDRAWAPILRNYETSREFEVVAARGRWIGAVMGAEGKPVLVVRTFVT